MFTKIFINKYLKFNVLTPVSFSHSKDYKNYPYSKESLTKSELLEDIIRSHVNGLYTISVGILGTLVL